MKDNIVDFESKKHDHEHKRKEAKVDALRRAFRQARGVKTPDSTPGKSKKGRNPGKK